MAAEFAEFIAQVRAKDDDLRRTLRKDEELVRQSAARMQGSLDKLTVKGPTIASTQQYAQGLNAVGQAASITGSALGGVASATAGLTATLVSVLPKLSLMTAGVIGGVLAIFAFRKEISSAIGKTLVWAGVLDDVTAAADRAEEALARTEIAAAAASIKIAQRLKEQTEAEKKLRAARGERVDLPEDLTARRTTLRAERLERQNAATLAQFKETKARIADEGKQEVERLKEVNRLEQERVAIIANQRRTEQSTRRETARGLALTAGFARPEDFARTPFEASAIMLTRRFRQLQAELAQSQTFGISSRPAGEFRFARPGRGAEFIGEQREEVKQTRVMEEMKALLEQIRASIKESGFGSLIRRPTGGALSFSGAGP